MPGFGAWTLVFGVGMLLSGQLCVGRSRGCKAAALHRFMLWGDFSMPTAKHVCGFQPATKETKKWVSTTVRNLQTASL